MCKYEMDPSSIVEDTVQTQFVLQMDEQSETCISLSPPSVWNSVKKVVGPHGLNLKS